MPAALSVVRGSGLASPRTVVGFLQRLEVFRGQPLRMLEQLAARVDVRRVRRGASIWNEGELAEDVFWVRSGVVRVQMNATGGRELTIDYFGRGELVGVHADGTRDDSGHAHEDVTLLSVSRRDFDDWIGEHASAAQAVVSVLARHGRRARERLALVTMNGAKARLAGLLIDLAERFGVRDSRGVIIDLRLTHREMASLIGATRETVSVAIVELRNADVLKTEHRRVIVLAEEQLEDLARA